MRNTLLKVAPLSIGLVLFGVYVLGTHAQPSGNRGSSASLTTNWVGYLVIGEKDRSDAIAPLPSPSVIDQVQIGLRSDGVLIWRKADGVQMTRHK